MRRRAIGNRRFDREGASGGSAYCHYAAELRSKKALLHQALGLIAYSAPGLHSVACPPATRMPCYYRQCVTMFTEELPWLTGRDQELVMGRALCDWVAWNLKG